MRFIGNSSEVIDWDQYVNLIECDQGRIRGTAQRDDIHHNPKVAELKNIWEVAGYTNNNAVGWIDYEISQDIVDKFAFWAGMNPIAGWITSVPPGYCVPWHPDYTDDEEKILSNGEVFRFTCHIGKPRWGQVFVLEEHVFHMESQGNSYQWSDWQDWHGGLNMGLHSKLLFNFLGYKR